MAIGDGKKFRRLEAKLSASGKVRNPAAVAAAIGRNKYGAERFNRLAQAGRDRAKEAPPQPSKPLRL